MGKYNHVFPVLFSMVAVIVCRPYNDGQSRELRSIENVIQSTSKNAIAFAQKAVKSFFPQMNNGENAMQQKLNSQPVYKRDFITKPYRTYQMPYQMVMVPVQYTGAQLYGGYVPNVQNPNSQNQNDLSKKFTVSYNYLHNGQESSFMNQYTQRQQPPAQNNGDNKALLNKLTGPLSNETKINATEVSGDKKSTEAQVVLKSIDEDTDGFYNAVTNTKEAMITKKKDGHINLVETIQGDSNSKPFKRNKIPGNMTIKAFQENYKRAVKSKGDLEKKLVNYFTDYICGDDC